MDYTDILKRLNHDIDALEQALVILNSVYLESSNPDNAVISAIRLLGGELAWLKRKRNEALYFKDKESA